MSVGCLILIVVADSSAGVGYSHDIPRDGTSAIG